MNAVETIQAAIVRLEELWGENPETWVARGRRIVPIAADGTATEPIAENIYSGDVKLIVTLHRTIDSQMAILLAALQASDVESNWDTLVYTEVALNLANAILGGAE